MKIETDEAVVVVVVAVAVVAVPLLLIGFFQCVRWLFSGCFARTKQKRECIYMLCKEMLLTDRSNKLLIQTNSDGLLLFDFYTPYA